MRKKNYHFIAFLLASIVFLNIYVSGTLNSPLSAESRKNSLVPKSPHLKITESVPLSVQSLESHDPIDINGNLDFLTQATLEGWSGTGTPTDPIIIEKYKILSNNRITPTFRVKNTDLYFKFCDNQFRQTYSAIGLFNVTNAQIINNDIPSCQYGVSIDRSHHITVLKNVIHNGDSTIDMRAINVYNSNFTTITNNTVNVSGMEYSLVVRALLLDASNNNIISYNDISNCKNVITSSFSSNNIFQNNQIHDCNGGVYFDHNNNDTFIFNTIKSASLYYMGEYKFSIEVYKGNMTILNNSLIYNDCALHFTESDQKTPNKIVVKWNDFIGNYIQAIDNSTNNVFEYNYWDEWTTPDLNEDGIVDIPYSIEGKANNHDNYPLTIPNDPNAHFLTRIRFIHPSYEEETLNGTVTVEWEAKDTQEHKLTYSLYYRFIYERENTSWHFIADLSETSYQWDTTNVQHVEPLYSGHKPTYILVLRVTCSEGLTLDYHSHGFKLDNSPLNSQNSVEVILFVVVFGGIFVISLVLIYSIFQKFDQKKI
ncbi:MAG: nitrous oxide reductase family maturation protein NosD [Promethearchaeota archaeon]